jgi:hypothetical protein
LFGQANITEAVPAHVKQGIGANLQPTLQKGSRYDLKDFTETRSAGRSLICDMSAPLEKLLAKIVSGGQTGADRAGLDWAIEHGIPHGGYCSMGRLAEDGPIPDRLPSHRDRLGVLADSQGVQGILQRKTERVPMNPKHRKTIEEGSGTAPVTRWS